MRQYRAERSDGKGKVCGWYFKAGKAEYIIPEESVRVLPLGYVDGPPCMDGFVMVLPGTVHDNPELKETE